MRMTNCSTSSATRGLPSCCRCVLPSHFCEISRWYQRRSVSGITRVATALRRFPYGQITRNREILEYSWSPALLHQQSAQLHAFLRVEIQEPRCGATFRSHALYAPIFSQLEVSVPALLTRMKQSHDAVGT